MALFGKNEHSGDKGIIVENIYDIPEVHNLLIQHRFQEILEIIQDIGLFESEINLGNHRYLYNCNGNMLKPMDDLITWITDQCPETRNFEKKKKSFLKTMFSSSLVFGNTNYKRLHFRDYLRFNPEGIVTMEDETLWNNDGTLKWELISKLISEEKERQETDPYWVELRKKVEEEEEKRKQEEQLERMTKAMERQAEELKKANEREKERQRNLARATREYEAAVNSHVNEETRQRDIARAIAEIEKYK